MKLSLCALVLLALFCPLEIPAQNLAGDMALSKVLVDGEEWQLVAEGYQFTDAACSDAEGNFLFTDVSKGTNIFRVGRSGKVESFINNAPKVSGMKFGPDGRLYACQGGMKRLIVWDGSEWKTLAEKVEPNDLVVTKKGFVYFTATGPNQVIMVTSNGTTRVVAEGVNRPNGITLSPDHMTLAVSEYGGTNVWTYQIQTDGSLLGGARSMTLRAPNNKPEVASGDGMTTDAEGRFYVTSAVGIQMFDATGRLSGVIAKPSDKGIVSTVFAGPNREYLYVCASDKIFRRKTKTQGAPVTTK